MKRYILLLALVSMQANIALPNIWENFKSNLKSNFSSKMNLVFGYFKFKTAQAQEPVENKTIFEKIEERLNKEEQERKAIVDEFEEKVDYLVDRKNLNLDRLQDFNLVKGVCGNYVRLLHTVLPSLKREAIMDQGGHCIADFAGFQGQDDDMPLIIDGSQVFYCGEPWSTEQHIEAYAKYKSGVSGSLRYLFASPASRSAIVKTAIMAKRRFEGYHEVIIPSSEAEYRSKR